MDENFNSQITEEKLVGQASSSGAAALLLGVLPDPKRYNHIFGCQDFHK